MINDILQFRLGDRIFVMANDDDCPTGPATVTGYEGNWLMVSCDCKDEDDRDGWAARPEYCKLVTRAYEPPSYRNALLKLAEDFAPFPLLALEIQNRVEALDKLQPEVTLDKAVEDFRAAWDKWNFGPLGDDEGLEAAAMTLFKALDATKEKP